MDTKNFVQNSLVSGAIATAATTVAAALCGEKDSQNFVAPINAVSHIAWGDTAAFQEDASMKYTATGAVLNAAAVTSWAAVNELINANESGKPDLGKALLGGAAVAALAYITDYYLVPDRLTPGFEKRVNGRSLFSIYTTLALSLAAGTLCRQK